VAYESNVELAKRLIASIRENSIDGVADLLDENVRMELPFAPEGMPPVVVGRAAVLESLRLVPQYFSRFRIHSHECYECTTRQTVILECTGLGLFRSPEIPPYQNRYVMLFTFRDGLVTQWREFFNPYPVMALAASIRRQPG
jgi:ketosteroid isomerase-like protein